MIHTAIGATASSAPQLGWQLAVFADLVSASSLVSRRAPTPGYTPDGQAGVRGEHQRVLASALA